MNRITRTILTAAALAALPLAACEEAGEGDTSASDVAKQAERTAQTAEDYAADQYAAFKDTMSDRIDGVNAQIQQLRDRASEMSESARGEINAAIESLESQRDQLQSRLSEAADTTGDAWGDVKDGLENAWTDLENAADRATDRFSEDG